MQSTQDVRGNIELSPKVTGTRSEVGDGCRILQFRAADFPGRAMSPFVMVDHFLMWKPTFPVHPHAGFSAVTLMFEDTIGAMSSVDSIGHKSTFGGGDLHWTLAGRGVMHTQRPVDERSHIHALQIFVNLPKSLKGLEPDSFKVSAADMPVITSDGARIRVVAGELESQRSPAKIPQPVQMLDCYLAAGGAFELPVQPDWHAWIYVVDGWVRVGDTLLWAAESVCADALNGHSILSIQCEAKAHFVVLAGQSIDEPLVQHGP